MNSDLNPNKWVEVCFEIGVAFEGTLSEENPPKYSTDFAFPQLVHSPSDESVIRVYHPSTVSEEESKRIINFIPWVLNNEDMLFYRFCLRIKPIGKTRVLREVSLARFGEDKPFVFSQKKDGRGYITLNFMGYNVEEFKPVYIKAHNDNALFDFYKISAEASEDGVLVTIEKVKKEDAPNHL